MGQEITMNDTQIIELQALWIKLMVTAYLTRRDLPSGWQNIVSKSCARRNKAAAKHLSLARSMPVARRVQALLDFTGRSGKGRLHRLSGSILDTMR
jgi:hypothetical protein